VFEFLGKERPDLYERQPYGIMDYEDARASYERGDMSTFRILLDVSALGQTELDHMQVYTLPNRSEAILLGFNCYVSGKSGTDARDLSSVHTYLQNSVTAVFENCVRKVPGFENAVITNIPDVGVRETRRIVGEYTLNAMDVLRGVEFEDSIAAGGHPCDVQPLPPEVENMDFNHWRFHIPYFSVHGNIGEDKTQASLERAVRIVRSIKKVKNLRIGSIGGRVPGFYTSCCSEMLLRDKIGSEVKTITMLEVVNEAKKLTEAEVDEAVELIKGDASCGVATKEEHVRKCAAMFAAIRKLKTKFGVSTFTMRCWPEIISDEMYGITACALIGHLTNHGDLTVCEGDVYAAVMLNLEKELSGIDPFFCDLIMCEDDSEYAVLWHCGAAPCSIRKEGYQSKLDFSSTVGGGGVKGVVHEFPLKPGKITLARLGETRDGSKFRMLIATGEGIDTDLFVRGNPLKVKFDGGCKKLKETVFNNGFEHHFSMSYGDISSELLEFCRVMDIEPIVVK
jgi:L-fucose isomerase-like protein